MTRPSLGQKLLGVAARRSRSQSGAAEVFPPAKIIIVRLNRLGDLVCALPLYRTLQASWPHARIDWLLSSQNAVLAPYLKMKGRCFVFTRSRVRYWLPDQLLRQLQSESYDLSIAVKGGYDSLLAWISLAMNARRRIGFIGKGTKRFDFAYTHPLDPPQSHAHQVEKCLSLVGDLKLPRPSDDISLQVPHSARERVRKLLHSRDSATASRSPFFNSVPPRDRSVSGRSSITSSSEENCSPTECPFM